MDPTTLLFTISLLGFASAAFALSSARAIGAGQVGLVEWGQAMAAVGGAFLLFFLRGHAPAWLTYVAANSIVLTVPAFGWLAYARFFDVDPHRRTIAALLAFGIVGPVAVHALGSGLGVGVFTMSVAMAAFLAMTGHLIVRRNGWQIAAPSTFAAALMLLLALVFVVRAVISLAGAGASVSMASDRGHMAWPLVIGTLFVSGATVGFVMMVHDRRRRDELYNASRDALTGLLTRAAFFEAAAAAQALDDEPYSLVVVDIDRFKDINDSHGHRGGDIVLAQAARLVLRSIRSQDVAGRFGGDEFCIVLRGCGEAEATQFCERLIFEASQLRVQLTDDRSLGFTMSAGHATRLASRVGAGPVESAEDLFERADAALYLAKRGGRARAVAALTAAAPVGKH